MLQRLLLDLVADDALEIGHQFRKGGRPAGCAEYVVGGFDGSSPVAQRFVERLLEGLRAGGDADHFGTQLAHPEDVGILPLDVFGAHVYGRIQSHARRHDRSRQAVLAGSGFGDDALLAHALYQ